MEGNILRGTVYEKFGSCSKFAKAIGWSGRKTCDIVNGRQIPNANEITQMAETLCISEPEEFMRVFFCELRTTKCGQYQTA